MARKFASLLGLLASSLLIFRGVIHGWNTNETIVHAVIAAILFAGIGLIAGSIAELLVTDSVQVQFQAAMAEFDEKQKNKTRRTKDA